MQFKVKQNTKMSPKMVEAESVGSNTNNCKRRLFTESSNSDTEASGSCNLEPVKRPRKVLKKMAGSSQAECFCTIPKIPSFTHEIASSISIFGSSRKRSYETISSRSISLAEQVADILNSMADSGHITPSKADDAAVIYSNFLNNGLRLVVRMFIMEESIEEKVAHLEFMITKYGEHFL
ncbi:uncharacterized protein LOC123913427 isoform X3 [Trifolium pratense]|nr:uncharacterized protein LOC123913427 isoform X3 [Trifolium pratense]XP_045820124.1 uncharacterized protein LOC123913427 isoform X3 [Trifolium pratense]